MELLERPNQERPRNEGNAIRVNGYAQVIEMLKIADPAFRESILNRLASRDKALAYSLRLEMRKLGLV